MLERSARELERAFRAIRRAAPAWAVASLLALVALCLRLPFAAVGIVPDEGGYAYVVSTWIDGGRVYHDAWVDRPQGLLLAYRALLAIDDDPVTIRIAALVAGAAITGLLFLVGRLAQSPTAGLWAAAVYAAVGIAPRLEGYTLNGELAAAVPATAAVAAALASRRSHRRALLVLAGLLGACGLLMKQSGFDGLAVAFAVAVSGVADGRARRAALVLAGAAVPLAASALHGLGVGFGAYWHAMVTHRLALSPPASERFDRVVGSLDLVARDLLPLAILAAAGAALCLRDRGGGRVALVWLAVAFAGLHVGGAYWPHYYVQLIAPLSLLAGIAIARLRRPVLRAAALAAAAAPVVALLGELAMSPPGARAGVIPSQAPADRDERVARYLRNRTAPHERVYVLVSRPNIYVLSGRRAPTPYVWHPPLREIDGALGRLERALARRDGAAFVVLYQPVERVDASGRLARVLARHYVRDRDAPPGLPVILRRDRRTHRPPSPRCLARGARATTTAAATIASGAPAPLIRPPTSVPADDRQLEGGRTDGAIQGEPIGSCEEGRCHAQAKRGEGHDGEEHALHPDEDCTSGGRQEGSFYSSGSRGAARRSSGEGRGREGCRQRRHHGEGCGRSGQERHQGGGQPPGRGARRR